VAFPTPQAMAYDRAATIFSPEGDLYQVRYAFEAVKKGWTSLGIKSFKGVVLAAEKRRLIPPPRCKRYREDIQGRRPRGGRLRRDG
jgi:proteasome alpha subunit